ncbi:hypothetical protein IWZ03DRAFT_415894 [Phyllosticta citriasiana]|uniref:Uncharacterized protein n=1 Tax=Phyllosticta citriasiana TaxID=595635 RepID=A0ABR1KI11_9PEZI
MTSLPITWQHDADYESARIGRVFNYRRPSQHPIAAVEASEESHIDEAVHLAIRKQCRISSGSHSWATALKPAEESHPPGAVSSFFFSDTSLSNECTNQGAASPNGLRYRVDNPYVNEDADLATVLEEALTTFPSSRVRVPGLGPASRGNFRRAELPSSSTIRLHSCQRRRTRSQRVCKRRPSRSRPICPAKLVGSAVGKFGRIEIVVNNAALAVNAPPEELTLDHWDKLVNLNGRGVFLLT